jgi:hypothetical protein
VLESCHAASTAQRTPEGRYRDARGDEPKALFRGEPEISFPYVLMGNHFHLL